jgi:hypothetical protein
LFAVYFPAALFAEFYLKKSKRKEKCIFQQQNNAEYPTEIKSVKRFMDRWRGPFMTCEISFVVSKYG